MTNPFGGAYGPEAAAADDEINRLRRAIWMLARVEAGASTHYAGELRLRRYQYETRLAELLGRTGRASTSQSR